MRTLTLFVLAALLTACQSEKPVVDQAKIIEGLETAYQQSASAENQQKLLDAYMAYPTTFTAADTINANDTARIGQYYFKAAKIHQQKGENDQARSLIPKATDMLAAGLYDPSSFRPNAIVANDFVSACELYASISPQDANAPTYLFRAAETARSTQNFSKALSLYDVIYQKYPEYEKAPQALFLKGFTLDNDLKQHEQAKEIYESFLEKHPDNEFADDTKFLISNIGKSDDEIIKSFESEETK